jgi:hypothetical protein
MRQNDDGKTVASFDVLAPEVLDILNIDWWDYWRITKIRKIWSVIIKN